MGTIAETKRAKLEREIAGKRADTELEIAILEALPDTLAMYDWRVYPFKLYDRVASLQCDADDYRIRSDAFADPTIDTVIDLARAFPHPAPLVIYRDSTVGIRSMSHAHAVLAGMNEEHTDHVEITRIAPFWCVIDHGRLSFHWITDISQYRIECVIKFRGGSDVARAMGRHDLEILRDKRGNAIAVARNQWTFSDVSRVLGNCAGHTIRYASGSPEVPGMIYLYWEVGNTDDPEISDDDGLEYHPLTAVDLAERVKTSIAIGGK